MDEHDEQHQPDAHDPELTVAAPAPTPAPDLSPPASDVVSDEHDAGSDEPYTNVDLSESHEKRLERLDAAEEANREKMEETETEDGQEKYAGGQIPAVSDDDESLDDDVA